MRAFIFPNKGFAGEFVQKFPNNRKNYNYFKLTAAVIMIK